MKIESIEVIIVDIPTIRAHKLSFGSVSVQNYALVRMVCDGIAGIGEAATIAGPMWGDESVETIKIIIDKYLAPLLLGQDPRNPNRLGQIIEKGVSGNRFAKAACEMAAWDLAARLREMSLSDLLGGRVHDSLPVAWTLAAGDSVRDIEEGQEMLRQRRHNIFKLKIGAKTPQQDFANVSAICKALAADAHIRVDVNQAWSELDAAYWIPRFAEIGVAVFEQPIAKWNVAGMARLAQANIAAIMADECVDTLASAFSVIAAGAADSISLKPAKSGGLAVTRKIAALAEAAGIALYGGTMLETAIGTACSAHLYATLPQLAHGCELFGHLLLRDTITANALEIRDFNLIVPSGPGTGMVIDEDKLAFYRRSDS